MKKKKSKNYIKNRRRRLKRKWNLFLQKLKKALLVTAVIFILIFIVPACIPADFVPEAIKAGEWGKQILKLHIFDDAADNFKDVATDIKGAIDEVIDTLQAIDRTLNSNEEEEAIQIDAIPPYDKTPYVVINSNIPYFTKEELTTDSYEYYSALDLLGRCGVTVACIGKDIMPLEERGPIGMVKPSGWKLKKYDIVDGMYIYNRCHLIGYQLTGENANVKNLITGTRYLNVEGMLPFENKVAEYVRKTGNHVMYRVTPIFEGNNLVASGVQMEAYSVEDKGAGICIHVYVYNVQPGIEIDYATGDNWLLE